ncbi:hypothetical protein AAG570_009687 [Ranatra chinensis]|uniref:tRNA pseudouridine synthase n=1 Tax=Ranatra chinensis TaxID=642074 RepID=A0ABD0Z2S3_9HEMI
MSHGIPVHPTQTIQSVLEIGLSRLKIKPLNEPKLFPCSRTDRGVHALSTTAHCDLEFPEGTDSISVIIHSLNSFLLRNDFDIRILDAKIVPDNFSARYSAIKKTYLYRFAVLKPGLYDCDRKAKYFAPVPIAEKDRCHFVFDSNFDHPSVNEASKLFIGTKDFRSFMGRPKINKDVTTVRSIDSLELRAGRSLLSCPHADLYNFWEVVCTGKSFLYTQVRRTVSVLISLAQGKLTLSDVENLFKNPSPESWLEKAVLVPGCGLYLVNVQYHPEDFLFKTNKKNRLFHTQTKVTTADGKVFLEEYAQEAEFVSISPIPQQAFGFVVDYKPDLQVATVLPGLSMGSQDVAQDVTVLRQNKITHILSLGVEVARVEGITYYYIDALDLPQFNLRPMFERCFHVIDSARKREGGHVFVHCNAGISRSSTIVVAYLMRELGLNFITAITILKKVRPVAKPNEGFVSQLLAFEREEHSSPVSNRPN